MPWVMRESTSQRSRARRAVRNFLTDHSQGLHELAFGALCAGGVLGALYVLGFI